MFLEQPGLAITHPANPVLALSKYQRRHEVVITSRTEEVTSPIVNTHCNQYDNVRQSSEREGVTKQTVTHRHIIYKFRKVRID